MYNLWLLLDIGLTIINFKKDILMFSCVYCLIVTLLAEVMGFCLRR